MSTPRRPRFRPGGWDALEERVVLSTLGLREPLQRPALRDWSRSPAALRAAQRAGLDAARPAQAPAALRIPRPPAARILQTPAAIIDQQYAAFRADVDGAIGLYLGSFAVESSRTVQLTLAEAYEPGSGLFVVAERDLPAATADAPLRVAARPAGGGARLYQITGTASGLLTGVESFNPASGGFGTAIDPDGFLIPAPDAPLPAGTSLEIVLLAPTPDFGSVADQFVNFVAERTLRLSQDLVTYFNRLPIRLPKMPGAYHTPRPETAIQFFLANQIAGQGPQLLLTQLLDQPLPAPNGAAIDLYRASIDAIINGSQEQVREGVRLLFSGRSVLGVGQLTPTIPGQP